MELDEQDGPQISPVFGSLVLSIDLRLWCKFRLFLSLIPFRNKALAISCVLLWTEEPTMVLSIGLLFVYFAACAWTDIENYKLLENGLLTIVSEWEIDAQSVSIGLDIVHWLLKGVYMPLKSFNTWKPISKVRFKIFYEIINKCKSSKQKPECMKANVTCAFKNT